MLAAPRIVFMGTPEFAVPSLRALLDGGCRVAAVYTQPDRPAGRGREAAASPVKRLAVELGIEVLQPRSLREPEALARLAGLAPDLIVVVAYGLLLPASVLGLPRYGCLNVHPSLLPRHRGPSPIPWAILDGDAVTGVTMMLMDEGMDTGPILEQVEEPVRDDDTALSLSRRLAALAAALLPRTVGRWARGEIKPQPQDDARASYSRLITKADGQIDWRLPA
ncbi:MAG: methionyl-tRNA formyltransferase, partial [Chloroflexi bacterium]|nr:methionyl-tRNA formyltransferase [Chloroflexota bacterium]